MTKINIKKKVHHKGFNNMFIKGIENIDKKNFVKKILKKIKQQTNENLNFPYLSEIENSLKKYPYENDSNFKFQINDYEIFEMSRLEEKNFLRYLIYRYKYKVFPKEKIYDDFPPCVQIEPTSKCNFRCIMCYQSDDTFSSKKSGYMGDLNLENFKRVIDEIEGNVESVTFASRGEPTLNKNLSDFLKYCENKFLALKINTNVSTLNESKINDLLSSGLQTIVFSIDSADKDTYEKIRVKSKYERLLKNLELFYEIKEKNYSDSKIIVRISGVLISTDQKIDNMIAQYEKFADMISFTNMIPWQSSYDNPINEVKDPCTELWRRVFVWQDGLLNPCDYDYKSKLSKYSIKDITIKDLWNSDYYNNLRDHHLNGKRSKIYPCNRCIAV